MRRRNFLRLGSDDAIGGAPAATQGRTVRGWNQLALRALHDTQSGPSASARALAMLHTCMYNAWAAFDDDARQTVHGRAVRLPRGERSAASKASAISHAAYIALCDRFPSHQARFDARMARLGLDPSRPDGQFTPAGIGHTQAMAMLDFWRRNSATAADEPSASLPFAPLPPGQSGPASPAAQAPCDRGAGADADLADHWCGLAQQLSERDGYDDERDVLLYFVLANALADAGIAAADAGLDRSASQVAAGAAAAAVLRSFTGNAGVRIEALDPAGLALGRQVGARVFEKARRYWQGKL